MVEVLVNIGSPLLILFSQIAYFIMPFMPDSWKKSEFYSLIQLMEDEEELAAFCRILHTPER